MSNGVTLANAEIRRSTMVKWFLTIMGPLLLFLIPTTSQYTPSMRLFFVVTLICILVMAFELTDMLIPSMALPILYILTGLAKPAVVFAPWLGTVPWMNLGGLMLAAILLGTGLLKRVAYWCIVKTGGSYKGILYALMAAGILMNVVIPGQTLVPLATLSYSICQALNLGKSKESAGIMLAGFFAVTIPSYFFYSSHFVMFQGVGMSVTDVSISWLDFLVQNIMLLPWCFILIFVLSKLLKPSQVIQGGEYFRGEYKAMGSMSSAEKKSLVICLVLLIMLVTNRYHGIQPAWIYIALVVISALPGINIATKETLSKVNYPFIFLITGCMAIGEVSNALGVGAWISDMLMPILSNSSITVILVLVWLLSFVVNFLLTPVAIASAFVVPLTEIALNLSINPHVIYYTMIQGADQLILPYEWPFVFFFFSFGLIPLKDFIKVFSVKAVISFIYFLVVLIPFWKLISLI